MRKKNKARKKLSFRSLKQFSRLLFAFFGSLIIIVNYEEEQKRQLENDNERMEAFFETFDNDVTLLAMSNDKTTVSQDLFSDYTKKTKLTEYQMAIEEYSLYFNLNSEKVFEFTRSLTNDFEEPLTITIGRKSFTATNAETTAMFITCDIWKDIYNTPSYKKKYNLNKEEYVTSEDITHFERNEQGEIVMRNGRTTFHQLLAKASNAIDKSPDRAAGISDHETGFRTSSQAKDQNNFGGMKGSGIPGVVDNGHITLPSPEAGTIYYVFNLERIENSFNYNGLYEFSGVYVNGTKTQPSDTWFKDVKNKTAMYAANEDFYFSIPEDDPVYMLAYTKQD